MDQRLSARRSWLGLRSRALGKQNRRGWRPISQRRMWPHFVVEWGLRTPTGPPAGRFSIGFIRGSGAKFSSMTRSIRSMASCSGARSTAQTSSGCSRSPRGCSIALHARQKSALLPSRRQSASAQRIILPARSGVEGYGAIIESPGSERIQSLSRPESGRNPWRGRRRHR